MRRPNPRWHLPLLLALLFCAAPVAAERGERWFEVELIVFANLSTPANAEVWHDVLGTPDRSNALELLAEQTSLEQGNRSPIVPVGLQGTSTLPRTFQLAGESLQLSNVYRRLAASSHYEPLLHLAWRQPGLPEEEALKMWLELPSAAPTASAREAVLPGEFSAEDATLSPAMMEEAMAEQRPRLEGWVRLVLSRYLHLQTDLLYRAPIEALEANRPNGELDELLPGAAYRSHRLIDSRRMRSTELHHLDHPKFGVLVVVNRSDPPQGR